MRRFVQSLWFVAILAGLAAPACVAERTVRMQASPDPGKDLGAMPRILAPRDDAERKINAAVAS